MKKYVISVKRVQETTLAFSEKSRELAIRKIKEYITKCLKNNLSLDDLFEDSKSVFKYKVIKSTPKNKSNVQ